MRKMLVAFQNRLKIRLKMPLGSLIPAIIIPLMFAFAAINATTTIVVFASTLIFITYGYYFISKRQMRTRFFFAWIFWSVIYMTILFEFCVPLLELLPEENFILIILALGSLCFLWRTHSRASLNNVVHSHLEDLSKESAVIRNDETISSSQTTSLFLEETSSEETRSKSSQFNCKHCSSSAFTDHCYICAYCVLRRRHHSYCLDCCIGEWNFKYYIFGLILAELALLLGSNLTLTAICHPVLVVRLVQIPIMLPDDCTGVYDDYKLSLAFVIATYAAAMALCVLLILIRQFYLLLRGHYERSIYPQKRFIWRSI